MKPKTTKIKRNVEKYYRWFRRSWHRSYMKTVKILELELGYEIHAC
ncbi:MAG: hypothetical protein Q8R76_13095 [Candidatus Omnitrophota bacterium]|nr:hypothetical protein [Candidatus Omnitrophota bacterium]